MTEGLNNKSTRNKLETVNQFWVGSSRSIHYAA